MSITGYPTVNPRTCGENKTTVVDAIWGLGQSPHLRGKPCGWMITRRKTRVNPRAYGENRIWGSIVRAMPGQSPRLRGKRASTATACASRLVNPRTCGENKTTVVDAIWGLGQSPHLRGERYQRNARHPVTTQPSRPSANPHVMIWGK